MNIKLQNYRVCLFIVALFASGESWAQDILDNTQLRFFTDTGFTTARDSTGKFAPSFNFRGISLIVTSQVTDKISVLAEPVLRADGTISMERAMLKYSVNQYLNISAGRLYTPFGLWNTTYFRYAKALTPTIDTPQVIANFEEGGVSINKDNGIQISGDDISKLRFGYRIMVGNGYTAPSSRSKAIYANLLIEPVDNLKFSVSGLYQNFPAGTLLYGAFPLPNDLATTGLNASVMYMEGKNFQFAAEYNKAYTSSPVASTLVTNVLYVYAGYKLKSVTPYLQYYNGLRTFGTIDYTNFSLGARYSLSALSVIKVETLFLQSDNYGKLNQFKVLWAIGF